MKRGFELDEALEASADVLEVFRVVRKWPKAPAYSGGVMDEWPARMVDGLAVAETEWRLVLQHVQRSTPKEERHG